MDHGCKQVTGLYTFGSMWIPNLKDQYQAARELGSHFLTKCEALESPLTACPNARVLFV